MRFLCTKFLLFLSFLVHLSIVSISAAQSWTPYRDMFEISDTDEFGGAIRIQDERYLVVLATFGFDLYTSTLINIMLPPSMSNATMCTYPSSLQNMTAVTSSLLLNSSNADSQVYYDTNIPLAFLVKRGDCYVEQKARVLLEISQALNLTNTLKWLLVYDHDPETDGDLTQFRPIDKNTDKSQPTDIDDIDPSILDGIGIATVPYRYAQKLLQRIAIIANTSNTAPFFLHIDGTNTSSTNYTNLTNSLGGFGPITRGDNRNWHFIHRINSNEERSDELRNYTGIGDSSSFQLFRFILFAILLTSPCIRLGYLWYSGGGRVLLRRNPDTGRICGLQYIPPMHSWLTGGRIGNSIFLNGQQANVPNPTDPVLKEEEFNALPIIVYQNWTKVDESVDENNDDNNNSNTHDDNCQQRKNDENDLVSVITAERIDIKEKIQYDVVQNTQIDENRTALVVTSPAASSISIVSQDATNQKVKNNSERLKLSTDEGNTNETAVQNRKSDDDEEKQLMEAADTVIPDKLRNDKLEKEGASFEQHEKLFADRQQQHIKSNTSETESTCSVEDHDDVNDTDSGFILITNKNDNETGDDQQLVKDDVKNETLPHSVLTTTCTMCSICIDDFVVGEHLVLLPRCKHAFHRACIHPWVLERNGCCPLCKTPVLNEADASTNNGVSGNIGIGEANVTDTVHSALNNHDSIDTPGVATPTTAIENATAQVLRPRRRLHNFWRNPPSTTTIAMTTPAPTNGNTVLDNATTDNTPSNPPTTGTTESIDNNNATAQGPTTDRRRFNLFR